MERDSFLNKITNQFTVHPITALLGPRQCGKTTLALIFAQKYPQVHIFDLEDPLYLAQLENPMLTLDPLEGLIVIDEIQLRPDLFPALRVLVDKNKARQKYLILGSASRDLIQQSSETLAGRIGYLELTPFNLREATDMKKLWLQGGFPRSYLADTLEQSILWRSNYIKTYLERDIPNLGIRIPAQTLRRFWTMLLAFHGNVLNMSDLGRSLGVSNTAIRHYIEILEGTFMIRVLLPWYENITKRQVKSPKIYFRDSGIMHTLMGIETHQQLQLSPKLGASWEGFALEEVIRKYQVNSEACYFWAAHSHAELDLILFKGGKKLGFEFKYTDQPKLTRSIKIALETLNLDELTIVIPRTCDFKFAKNVRVVGLEDLIEK